MTLTTHAVIGGIVASFFPTHPEIGFMAAFGSHFILDAIPHWDYNLKSYEMNSKNLMDSDFIFDKRFVKDLINIGLDILIGLIVSTYVLIFLGKFSLPILIAGALGGIIPDAFQVVYTKFRYEPFVSLQKFHIWIQKNQRLKNKPLVGVIFQIILITLLVTLVYFK